MYSIEYTGQFKRSLKLCRKRGLPLEELHEAISLLEPHQAGLASALAAK